MDRLLAIVGQHHHRLIPREMEDVGPHRERFKRALLFLAFSRKSDKPSPYSLASFADACNGCGAPTLVLGHSSPPVSHLDVRVSDSSNFPYDIDLALQVGTTSQPVAAWRSVLSRSPAPQLENKRRIQPRVTNLNLVHGAR